MSFQHVSIRITYDVQRIFLFKKASKVASKRQYFWRGEGYSYAEILLRFKSSVIVVRQK